MCVELCMSDSILCVVLVCVVCILCVVLKPTNPPCPGSHKERFDADGKGKGIEGRANVVDNTGYVGAYKGADTFDTK